MALATSEAEYIAGSEGAREGIWLGVVQQKATVVRTDSQGCLKLLQDISPQKRGRQIRIHHHHVRELVEQKELEFQFVGTKQQVADVLTKALPFPKCRECSIGLGLRDYVQA